MLYFFGDSGTITYAEEETHSQLYTIFNQILMFHVPLRSLLFKVFCPHLFASDPCRGLIHQPFLPVVPFPAVEME